MTKQKSTKRALLMSALALLMCVSMLIGSTFAWFTDSVTSAGNKIQAGTLDIELWKVNSMMAETEQVKDEALFNYDLWEPGYAYATDLKLKNVGTLDAKFIMTIVPTTEVGELAEVIDVYYTINNFILWKQMGQITGNTSGMRDYVKENYAKLGTLKDVLDGTVKFPETAIGADNDVYIQIAMVMQESAGNEYQGKSAGVFDLRILATQLTSEKDSFGSTYDEDATYGTGATIIGLKDTYDSLTAAAKAWRESKGVVTSGSTFGMNTLGTVDSITWVVSGEVATGDGEGVIGNNGAGQSILGGGYFTPSVTVNNIIIKGVNDAKIAKTGDSYLVSAAGKNVVYENITFVDTVRIDSNPANLTFKNCKFEAGFRMPHSATNGNVTIENCTFTGNESSGYAIFAQGNMASFKINGNTVSNCQRGINVQAGNNAVVTINGNTITNITGKTDGFTYGAAIQLTSAKTFTVTNNTVSNVAVNAFHIYNGCAADSIVISDNNISAAYLCWNEANYTNVTSSGNTLNITNSGKCVTKTAEVDSNFALN